MFVGEQGCGKTSIVRDKLNNQDDDVAEFHSLSVYCNQFTSSRTLWRSINNCLEWKHGRTYIPKGNKKLICLVDDLNLSKVLSLRNKKSTIFDKQNRNYNRSLIQIYNVALLLHCAFCSTHPFYLLARWRWRLSVVCNNHNHVTSLKMLHGYRN